jgi:hypothetical protein
MKAISRNTAEFVILAADIEPIEIVLQVLRRRMCCAQSHLISHAHAQHDHPQEQEFPRVHAR